MNNLRILDSQFRVLIVFLLLRIFQLDFVIGSSAPFSYSFSDNHLKRSFFYSDPFSGKYKADAGGVELILEIKNLSNGQFHIYLNGLGPDLARQEGSQLTGVSSGFVFFIRKSKNGIILNLNNQDIYFESVLSGQNSNSGFTYTDPNVRSDHASSVTKDFSGKYITDLNGTELNLDIRKVTGNSFELFINGQGPDQAVLEDGLLRGVSAGLAFTIRHSDNGIVFNMKNQDIQFSRLSNEGSKKSQSSAKSNNSSFSSDDPFSGIYDVSYMGQVKESWTIERKSSNQYILKSPSGHLTAHLSGHTLSGFDNVNNINFSIKKSGETYEMDIQGIKMNLINRRPLNQINNHSNSQLDNRLFGIWSGSDSYNSYGGVGTASISFYQKYLFKADGTYEYLNGNAGGGDGYSASSESGIERGTYQILSMNNYGGVINVNGTQMEYLFYSNGAKMKMGKMNYSRQ